MQIEEEQISFQSEAVNHTYYHKESGLECMLELENSCWNG